MRCSRSQPWRPWRLSCQRGSTASTPATPSPSCRGLSKKEKASSTRGRASGGQACGATASRLRLTALNRWASSKRRGPLSSRLWVGRSRPSKGRERYPRGSESAGLLSSASNAIGLGRQRQRKAQHPIVFQLAGPIGGSGQEIGEARLRQGGLRVRRREWGGDAGWSLHRVAQKRLLKCMGLLA